MLTGLLPRVPVAARSGPEQRMQGLPLSQLGPLAPAATALSQHGGYLSQLPLAPPAAMAALKDVVERGWQSKVFAWRRVHQQVKAKDPW